MYMEALILHKRLDVKWAAASCSLGFAASLQQQSPSCCALHSYIVVMRFFNVIFLSLLFPCLPQTLLFLILLCFPSHCALLFGFSGHSRRTREEGQDG